MRTVHKYPLEGHSVGIYMPEAAEILTLQLQNDVPTLWALVEDSNTPIHYQFHTYGTGWTVPLNREYVGTYQQDAGNLPVLVWHVFKETR